MESFVDVNYWIFKNFVQDPDIFVEIGDGGRLWFIGKRVAAVLGFTTSKQQKDVLRRDVSPENKKTMKIKTPGGPQNMICISLEGIFELLSRSRSKLSDIYRDMSNQEVYPTLFTTGAYISDIKQYTNEEVLKWPIQMPEKDYENIYNKSIRRKEFQRKLHKKD